MRHIKVWQVVGQLSEDEVHWLYHNKFDAEVEKNQIHFEMVHGSHQRVTIPDVTKIIIRTYGDSKESMLCLKFGNRMFLFNEFWEDDFHGCRVNF